LYITDLKTERGAEKVEAFIDKRASRANSLLVESIVPPSDIRSVEDTDVNAYYQKDENIVNQAEETIDTYESSQ